MPRNPVAVALLRSRNPAARRRGRFYARFPQLAAISPALIRELDRAASGAARLRKDGSAGAMGGGSGSSGGPAGGVSSQGPSSNGPSVASDTFVNTFGGTRRRRQRSPLG